MQTWECTDLCRFLSVDTLGENASSRNDDEMKPRRTRFGGSSNNRRGGGGGGGVSKRILARLQAMEMYKGATFLFLFPRKWKIVEGYIVC